MSSSRILIDPAHPMGELALEAATAVIQAQHAIERIRDAANRMTVGDDWPALEAELGLPTGKGQDFWFLLNSAADAMGASIINEFAQRIDQG